MIGSPSTARSAGRPRAWRPVAILAVAVAYAAIARLGHLTTTLPGAISPIYPSAGIALAAVLVLGRPALLGVVLGSIVANASNRAQDLGGLLRFGPGDVVTLSAIGLGAALAAALGARLVRRLCGEEPPLQSARNVLMLVTAGALGAAAISSTVGVLTLWWAGFTSGSLLGYSWLTWLLGDAFGIVIAAPLVLAWQPPWAGPVRAARLAEATALGGTIVLLSLLVFFRNQPFEYGLMPLLIWAAFRFGVRGTSTAAAAIAVFATIGTSLGTSPFVRGTANDSLLALHSFLGVTIIFALLLAGVLAERQRMEDARARLAIAVEQAGDSVVITDLGGAILYVNPAFEEQTGYRRQEAMGQNPRLLKSGQQDAAFYVQMWGTLSRGRVWSGRLTNRRKDGALYEAELTISPIRDPGGTVFGYAAVQRDVTQEIALEAQLRQAQRMESVGQLAGGVAHDFNNILAAIRGFAELQVLTPLDRAEQVEFNEQVVLATERAAALTRQLLLFGRQQDLRPASLDLNEAVRGVLKMLRRVVREDIGLETELAAGLPRVKADAGMIEQVLLNLVLNARDAMPDGGRLTVRTGTQVVDDAAARRDPGTTAGAAVFVEVVDTGVGIAAEVLPRLFEPFFTTKEAGQGTGLGLAVVHGIVKQHHGWITVHSERGRGSVFRVVLPAGGDGLADRAGEVEATVLPGGTETILVVEDDAQVRRLVATVLRRCGHQVLEADSGPAALELWTARSGAVHLVFTDVVLPGGLSGPELAGRLRAERPDLRVVYTSGYGARADPGLPLAGGDFLRKPFSPVELAQAVRRCLDRAAGPA